MDKDIDRLERARRPGKLASQMHPIYKGKIEISLKAPVRSFSDFAIWYTPGVATPCREIASDHWKVWEHTNRGNTIAVVSDGTRVLGLGNIGPQAALPVMEGKALLFKYLGGVDAFPICLGTTDPEEIIRTVKALEPCLGGINLEDIATPQCFHILERLRKEMEIPVWHDDQQGTATVEVAGFVNAAKVVGKRLDQMQVTMIGAGAANIRIASILTKVGVRPNNIIMCDSKGILNQERKDLSELEATNPEKYKACIEYSGASRDCTQSSCTRGSDAILCASRPIPGTVTKDMIRDMADKAIVFAAANPEPEIWPWDAKEAGAYVIATGRSDFPNQINNSLGFPGIFRGALDVMARTITDEMCIAAAMELAKVAEDKGLTPEYIIPNMEEWEVYPREAAAVGEKAIEQGVARFTRLRSELLDMAYSRIERARNETKLKMDNGIIPKAPEGTSL
ncbi:MAG: NADP-dependent malic enzyme [Candidatus Thermoplasmatota archaeon]|nr:NADP-dependent malic enzyme [Candidatus Thermoplasmatota archaeon]